MCDRILIQKTLHHNTVPDVRLDNLVDIINGNHAVQRILREDLDKRTL